MTNSHYRGGDINKQITLYRWRYTIQQKKNNFEHESVYGMNIMTSVMLLHCIA